ncbi:MAG: AAA family ATPase [Deltaproteobacteria bacterium]|nr:AAA family ATPase [Deltaproteobacteria bacterium]
MSELDINLQFQTAFNLIVESGCDVFITGKAGTGKSTFLAWLRDTTAKSLAVLAPTGVAALNVQGQTIHSFFRFMPGITVEDAKKRAADIKNDTFYKHIKTIVIDEVSMVRADLLDCIDVFLRTVLKKKQPFGGVQMIFIGDLYQLPPVVSSHDREHFKAAYDSPYFFSSQVMTGGDFKLEFVELEKIYRQKDERFIDILNAVRRNEVTEDVVAALNERVTSPEEDCATGCIHLTTTNEAAGRVNEEMLGRLKKKAHSFTAQVRGDFDLKQAPADAELRLKEGAQVMMLTNNSDGLWVNGTIGRVEHIDNAGVDVRLPDGDIVPVDPYKWTLYRYVYDKEKKSLSQESIGTFTQYPLALAWAVTIHKSQGKTFDRVVVDFGRGTFAHGQAYVALSRCRTLEGMTLRQPLKKSHIIMDWRVIKFLTRYQYAVAEKECCLDDKVALIEQAIERGGKIAITYLKPNDQKSRRTVRPRYVGELEYQGKLYLGMQAFCMQRQENRTFRVDRILEMELVKK